MIRVHQILLPVDHTDDALRRAVLSTLGIRSKDLISTRVHRRGVDARHPRKIRWVYSLDVETADEPSVLAKKIPNVSAVNDEPFVFRSTSARFSRRPVVVGTGPPGLFAGLLLARAGARPIFLERGRPVDERVKDVELMKRLGQLDPESNIQFGEGGAGTFSDGKLNTSVSDPRCRWVLEQWVNVGAPPDILMKAKPHVGTDRIRESVKRFRCEMQAQGGEFRFSSKVTGLHIQNGRLRGVEVNGTEIIESDVVVLAVGNAARDTFEMLHRCGVIVSSKPFSVGARIEHPRTWMDQSLYGACAGHARLGAADYKMAHHGKNFSAYTFCMCPGGVVLAGASQEGGVVTNGMSEYARDRPNSNSALMVGVSANDFGSDHPLAGAVYQQKWEQKAFQAGEGGFKAPVQRVEDFLARRRTTRLGEVTPSYLPGVTMANLWDCMPKRICEGIAQALGVFALRIKKFAHPDALLTGIETRSSSPIKIHRDEKLQSNIRGLYPAGEGAGHAGGIMSSAVDGIRVAEMILQSGEQQR